MNIRTRERGEKKKNTHTHTKRRQTVKYNQKLISHFWVRVAAALQQETSLGFLYTKAGTSARSLDGRLMSPAVRFRASSSRCHRRSASGILMHLAQIL